jgi:hypothetical protein
MDDSSILMYVSRSTELYSKQSNLHEELFSPGILIVDYMSLGFFRNADVNIQNISVAQ